MHTCFVMHQLLQVFRAMNEAQSLFSDRTNSAYSTTPSNLFQNA